VYVNRRYNVFTGCVKAKTCTIVLRGGAEQFIEETERSLHDAIMIVRRTIKNDAIVAGVFLLQSVDLMTDDNAGLAVFSSNIGRVNYQCG